LKTSIIIAFYNRIDFIQLVLAGFERQSFKEFEIIIADDGSDEKSLYELKEIIKKSSLSIKHVWHEDKGFRKNEILNKAILESASDYLVFVDGDCIPHREFTAEHFRNRAEKKCLAGRRVNLSKRITSKLNPEEIKNGFLEKKLVTILFDSIFGKTYDAEKGFYIKSQFVREIINRKKRGLLGSNFSIHKKDLLDINGFDERYDGASVGEDTDIQFRLELNGVKIESLNNAAIQYHIYHDYQERAMKNWEIFKSVKKSGIYFTPYGIQK